MIIDKLSMKLFSACLVIILLVGCVEMGVKPKDPNAEFVPAPEAIDGKVNLYIVRAYAQPTARKMTVYVDDQKVTKLGNFSYSWIPVSPGKYNIRSEWGWDTAKPKLEFEIEILEETFLAFGGGLDVKGNLHRWTSEAYKIPKKSVATAMKGTQKKVPLIPELAKSNKSIQSTASALAD